MRRIVLALACSMRVAGAVALACFAVAGHAAEPIAQQAQAGAQNYLVLFSSSPTYKKGDQLIAGTVVELTRRTEKLVVLNPQGQPTTFTGPTKTPLGPVNGPVGGTMLTTIAQALTAGGPLETVLGASRSGVPPGPLEKAWIVDLAHAKDVCVPPSGALYLTVDHDSRGRLEFAGTGGRVAVTWPASAERIAWPRQLALTDGGRLSAQTPPRPSSNLVLHIMPAGDASVGARLQWLLQSGCGAQAAGLIDGLAGAPTGAISVRSATGEPTLAVGAGGAPLDFTVFVNRAGYLTCLYRAPGTIAKAFPSGDAPGAVSAALPQRVPALGQTPLQLMPRNQPGTDSVLCVVADAPGAQWLPPPLRGGGQPMPFGDTESLVLPPTAVRADMMIEARP